MRKSVLIVIMVTILLLFTNNCSKDEDGVCEGKNAIVCLIPFLVSSDETTTFSIGGTITGLTADGLVLQNNAADDLTVSANATTFTFATKISGAYSVTVKTQPTGLTCSVSSGSGTATADVSNVAVACVADSSTSSCSGTSVTRNWGTFTDCNNGTVKLVVTAGEFGGNTYTAKTLYFAKCTHGQTWNSSSNDCTGTGSSGTNYGATTVQYCNLNDNSCNGGTSTGTLDGSGTSEAYSACNGLSLASKTWRVPTKDELKLLINCNTTTEMPNDGSNCSGTTPPTINNLFPNTVSGIYRSSSGRPAFSIFAWDVYFSTGFIGYNYKTFSYYVRCVSDGL